MYVTDSWTSLHSTAIFSLHTPSHPGQICPFTSSSLPSHHSGYIAEPGFVQLIINLEHVRLTLHIHSHFSPLPSSSYHIRGTHIETGCLFCSDSYTRPRQRRHSIIPVIRCLAPPDTLLIPSLNFIPPPPTLLDDSYETNQTKRVASTQR